MPRINFDLQQLEAFVAVADKGSFRAAADHLHLSPAALSRRVDRLEQLLGARLFARTTRDVQLTRVGDAFLARARAALDDLESAVLGINEISARHAGRVTVACLPSGAVTLMPRAIAAFRKAMPYVRVRILDAGMQEVAASVLSGEADFGVGFATAVDPAIDFEPLAEDRYVLAVRRDDPLARKRHARLADFSNAGWLSVARTSGNRQLLDEYFEGSGRTPAAWLEVSHVATLLAMVEAGLGVGIVPALALDAKHHAVKGIALADLSLKRRIGVLTLANGRLTPLAERFKAQVRAVLPARH